MHAVVTDETFARACKVGPETLSHVITTVGYFLVHTAFLELVTTITLNPVVHLTPSSLLVAFGASDKRVLENTRVGIKILCTVVHKDSYQREQKSLLPDYHKTVVEQECNKLR